MDVDRRPWWHQLPSALPEPDEKYTRVQRPPLALTPAEQHLRLEVLGEFRTARGMLRRLRGR